MLLPRLFGSPDHRQIDGVGGATSTTSKAMILHRPADGDVDVEFTFAQVGIEEAAVDWGSNCGNCSAVVGLYAIEKGWVVPTGDVTRIVTRNTNTGQIIIQRVATPSGALPIVPQAQMPGVPFPGYRGGAGLPGPCRQNHRPAASHRISLRHDHRRRNPLDRLHGRRRSAGSDSPRRGPGP